MLPRYQVYARPPPIPCPPRSLREVTDARVPIRYNVKRVAVNKPFPPPNFKCIGHLDQEPLALERECETPEAGQDSSRNNNTRPLATRPERLGRRPSGPECPSVNQNQKKAVICMDNSSMARKEMCQDQKSFSALVSERPQEIKGFTSASSAARLDRGRQSLSKTSLCRDGNNSHTCPRFAMHHQQAKCQGSVHTSKATTHSDTIKRNRQSGRSGTKLNDPIDSPLGHGALYRHPMSRSQSSTSVLDDPNGPNVSGSYTDRTFSQDRNSHNKHSSQVPQINRPCRSSNSYLSSRSSRPGSARQCDRSETRENTVNLHRLAVNPAGSRNSSPHSLKTLKRPPLSNSMSPKTMMRPPPSIPMSPKGLARCQVSDSVSSIGSRPWSACSVSSMSSCQSVRRKASAINCIKPDQAESGSGKSSKFGRESVASLLTDSRPPSPAALSTIVGKGRRKYLVSQTASRQESVASLLNDSNTIDIHDNDNIHNKDNIQNNNYSNNNNTGKSHKNQNNNSNNNNKNKSNKNCINHYNDAVVLLASGAYQDVFFDLISHNDSFSKILQSREVSPRHYHGRKTFTENSLTPAASIDSNEFMNHKVAGEIPNCLCSNNNATVTPQTEPGTYILKCCPTKTCARQIQDSCAAEPGKMLCRFHGKRPKIPENQTFILDEVVPVDTANWKVTNTKDPQELQCTLLKECETAKPIESAEGPLMVCEPRKPTNPKIGYGTYKIVGSQQRREAPPPGLPENLRLPPDMEEYREFIRRCPNFRTGRYDRSDPLNEMLIPANKSSVLLRSDKPGPNTFCRLPRRKVPALFEPQRTSSDLSWSLPASFVNQ